MRNEYLSTLQLSNRLRMQAGIRSFAVVTRRTSGVLRTLAAMLTLSGVVTAN